MKRPAEKNYTELQATMDRSEKLRTFFARYIAVRAEVQNPAVESAFAAIPREAFLGPAPWFLFVAPTPSSTKDPGYLPTPDDDPAFAYHDGLIALDHEQGINNGEPSLHARNLDALGLQPGQHVLHVGAGTGYYTAILAHLVGPRGHVHAYEINPDLARRAAQNLTPYPWVTLKTQSGTSSDLPTVDAIYVNAGLTQPAPAWLEALRPGGQLLFPLQPKGGFGGMLLLQKPEQGSTWPARFICRAGFIACEDVGQDSETGAALKAAFEGSRWQKVKSFHQNEPPDDTIWCKGDGWWLSLVKVG
jgi:protein-L-isoaspartate(D-aspartate) O-methyltransferase